MKNRKYHKVSFWLAICLAFLITGRYGFMKSVDGRANPLLINEFVAANGSGLTDEDGDHSDWIEIYNRSNWPINLSSWSLTNDPDQPDKWPFPDIVLDSQAYLVVFASGKNHRLVKPGSPLHTNFKLSRQGEFLALYNILENRLTDVVSLQVDHFLDISYGRVADDLRFAYLVSPTPGEANDQVLAWPENISAMAANPEQAVSQMPSGIELTPSLFEAGAQSSLGEDLPLTPTSIGAQEQIPEVGSWNLPTLSPSGGPEPAGQLRITEIMYNPPGGDEYEFIELKNTGDQTVELAGDFFEGINFIFPLDTPPLPSGELLILVRNKTLFAERYPNVPISGTYDGHLSNQGELIALKDYTGRLIVSVAYDDENDWPMTPDGLGDSLVLVDTEGDPNRPGAWRASSQLYGSPGDKEIVANLHPHACLLLEISLQSSC